MNRLRDRRNLQQLWRFYQAALINTAFGFGVYALLVWFGLNIYVAQLIAQILGITFNYFTYSRHVFKDRGSKLSFTLSYIANYVINLCLLAIYSKFIKSPYFAGGIATISASLINYLFLKYLVFQRKER